ncbi:MAG: DUF1018 domain-containing protein [Zoogloea sp.]|uniref:phage protein GemA/Gp16 family protein n=1 Tax=Zoogloea sp. TaxID=49181 RepID=UPI00261CBB4D|nr:phage protein GemA/Gp16 family protein [Zoogloea sp.]MDD3328880.1 DUF1018 domain-containing protein [Zoogloea sp.]
MANIDPWNPDARKARIKAIKAATGPRGTAPMDDGTYRAMIGAVCPGKRSATELTVAQLDKVLAHIKRLSSPANSANPADAWRFVFRLVPDRQAHARKIFRLAERVGQTLTPPVPVAPKRYIEGLAAQMLQCETALEFCGLELLHKIVQALETHCKRHNV